MPHSCIPTGLWCWCIFSLDFTCLFDWKFTRSRSWFMFIQILFFSYDYFPFVMLVSNLCDLSKCLEFRCFKATKQFSRIWHVRALSWSLREEIYCTYLHRIIIRALMPRNDSMHTRLQHSWHFLLNKSNLTHIPFDNGITKDQTRE